MSLLDNEEARLLLEDAAVDAAAVRGCRQRIVRFLQRYLPVFYRAEQRQNATLVIQGRLSGLERKTSEPIAISAGVERKPIQQFVGAGCWDDEAVMAELRRHVAEELADPDGVLLLDSSGFPKKGTQSCGVARQWCGRLGKVDNCQVGVFVGIAAARGVALLDRRLYLPKEWAADSRRRKKCHVPPEVRFQEKWRIGLELLDRSKHVPHGWVTSDEEAGRVSTFRKRLRQRRERYVVDVPANTRVRDLDEPPPRRRHRRGARRKPPFRRVDEWAARQPANRWQKWTVRAGEKGPIEVEALVARVQTQDDRHVGPEERLVVLRTVEAEPKTHYALSNAKPSVPLDELVRVRMARHRIEELFEAGNGEVGLDHYEVRSWVGWHHHMTLSLLALWFLVLEKRRMGEKNPGHHGASDARNLQSAAA
jgi:SRSO17 transposase